MSKEIPGITHEAEYATNFERINSGVDTKVEYYDWMEEGKQVLHEMTTNGVEVGELDHKHKFLSNLDQRENELIVCLGLYMTAIDNPVIRAKFDEMLVKLMRLREIRSILERNTQDYADRVEKSNEEAGTRIVPTKEEAFLLTSGVVAMNGLLNDYQQEDKEQQLFQGKDTVDYHKFLTNWYSFNHGTEQQRNDVPFESQVLKRLDQNVKPEDRIKMLKERSIRDYVMSLSGRATEKPSAPQSVSQERRRAFDQRKFNLAVEVMNSRNGNSN